MNDVELEKAYEEYLLFVEKENFDIDMYDGDIYLPNITPLTFEEFAEVF